MDTMNANDRFEYMAELFLKETGLTAPGKDSCASFGCRRKETAKKWRIFAEAFYCELFQMHKDANTL